MVVDNVSGGGTEEDSTTDQDTSTDSTSTDSTSGYVDAPEDDTQDTTDSTSGGGGSTTDNTTESEYVDAPEEDSTQDTTDTSDGGTDSTDDRGGDGSYVQPEEDSTQDTTDDGGSLEQDTAPGTPGEGGEADAPDRDYPEQEDSTDSGGDTPTATPGEGGEVDAPESGNGFESGEQTTTPRGGGTADAPGSGSETVDPGGDPRDQPQGPQREDFDNVGDFVEARTEYTFDDVGSGEIWSVQDGNQIEARFTERGASQAVAEILGAGTTPEDVDFDYDPIGGFTFEDIQQVAQQEQRAFVGELQRYEGERQSLQEDVIAEALTEAGLEARAEAEERRERAAVGPNPGLGDQRELRRERVAGDVSEQLGFEVTDEDFRLREQDDGESMRVELTDEAQRAALLTSSAEFAQRDAEIERTDDGFRVTLPGDNEALEEALTRRVQGEEAFGGETKFDVPLFGTVNVEQAAEDFSGAVESGASQAGDFIDDANLLRKDRGAFVGEDSDDQSVVGAASWSEAGEDFMIKTLEGSTMALGEAPREVIEIGEAATDPLAYQAGAELSMMGVRRLPRNLDDAVSAGQGVSSTATRVDELARENPEAATQVAASLLGGAAVAGGLYAATPAALSRIASASPTSARAIAATLDPVKTSVRAGARGARRVELPDSDTLRLGEFRQSDRAMAQLTGGSRRQQTETDVDRDVGSDVEPDADFEPSRDYVLEGGTQERGRLDVVEQQRQDLEASRGDYEGEIDPYGRGEEATFDPESDVMDPEDVLRALERQEAGLESAARRQEAQAAGREMGESFRIREQAESREVNSLDDVVAQMDGIEMRLRDRGDVDTEMATALRRQEAAESATVFEVAFDDGLQEEAAVSEVDTEIAALENQAFDSADVFDDAAVADDTATGTATDFESVLDTEAISEVDTVSEVDSVTEAEQATTTETVTEVETELVSESELEAEQGRPRAQPDLDDEEDEEDDTFPGGFSVFSDEEFDTGIADVEELEAQSEQLADSDDDPAAQIEDALDDDV